MDNNETVLILDDETERPSESHDRLEEANRVLEAIFEKVSQ